MQRPVLEDPLGHPESRPGCKQVREDSGGGEQRGLQNEQKQQKPKTEHDADNQRGLGGEQVLQVMVFGGRAAEKRPGGNMGTQPVDGGAHRWVGGVLARNGGDQGESPAAGLCGHHLSDAGVATRHPGHRGGLPGLRENLQGAGRAGSHRSLDLVVADA